MSIKYNVTSTEPGSSEFADFSVLFETSDINEKDLSLLKEELNLLFTRRDIGNSVYREINLFMRNGHIIVLFKYGRIVGVNDAKRVKNDFNETLKHFIQILEIFNKEK